MLQYLKAITVSFDLNNKGKTKSDKTEQQQKTILL